METSEQAWLDRVRALVLRGDFVNAETAVTAALGGFPHSFELRRVLAGVYRQTHRNDEAEPLLRELLREHPQDAGCAFTLARLLIERANSQAAGQALRACFESGGHDANLAIRAIELLDEVDRKADAVAIAQAAIATAPDDPRLHAYAGMLQLQLGAFDQAREHYLFALEHSPLACEWHVPLGLANAQHYRDATHPDFALFCESLQRSDSSDKARSTLLFALGKAHDDIGNYAQATDYFREANAIAHGLTRWSRKDWRRAVETRLTPQPGARHAPAVEEFVPIFIVGMPRSGTTLLAELLARYPLVCNRGELQWIAKLAQQPDLSGDSSAEALARAADTYRVQTRRDDAPNARWFIDKQPLNFRYVDLMLGLFPNAKIIHCMRNPRDTALSLWMQSFGEDVQGFAYDFSDIAIVMRDCDRLMACWQRRYPDSIRTICYENLAENPESAMADLHEWLELPNSDLHTLDRVSSASIGTASLWQARQPVYKHSVQRWRAYAGYVPELMQFDDRP